MPNTGWFLCLLPLTLPHLAACSRMLVCLLAPLGLLCFHLPYGVHCSLSCCAIIPSLGSMESTVLPLPLLADALLSYALCRTPFLSVPLRATLHPNGSTSIPPPVFCIMLSSFATALALFGVTSGLGHGSRSIRSHFFLK